MVFYVLYKLENFENIFRHPFCFSLLVIHIGRKADMKKHFLLLLLQTGYQISYIIEEHHPGLQKDRFTLGNHVLPPPV